MIPNSRTYKHPPISFIRNAPHPFTKHGKSHIESPQGRRITFVFIINAIP